MKIDYLLLITYLILSGISIYCFLFQRTLRKIRQYIGDRHRVDIVPDLAPLWYSILVTISWLMYIPLIWLFFVKWEYAILAFLIVSFLYLVLPVNDYWHIQIIKSRLKRIIGKGKTDEYTLLLYNIILEIEQKTLPL